MRVLADAEAQVARAESAGPKSPSVSMSVLLEGARSAEPPMSSGSDRRPAR